MARIDVDVLMITYNRPQYTRVSLSKLLESSREKSRVWLWHNGEDAETLDVVRRYESQLHRFHHSTQNVGLTEPTNWLFKNADGDFLAKVDDDCVVPLDWIPKLSCAHRDVPELGVVACWHFQPEDFIPECANRKIKAFAGGHRLLVNTWVGGSGYLMKRACVDQLGILKRGQSFSNYCIEISQAGWTNGWIYPFLYQDHMDDPRSPRTSIKSDEDLAGCLPLSARRSGVQTVEEWTAQLRKSARQVQEAPIDKDHWSSRRRMLRRIRAKLRRFATGSQRHR
jgi:glycosyltransferase involved in cell wall biosynthesis